MEPERHRKRRPSGASDFCSIRSLGLTSQATLRSPVGAEGEAPPAKRKQHVGQAVPDELNLSEYRPILPDA